MGLTIGAILVFLNSEGNPRASSTSCLPVRATRRTQKGVGVIRRDYPPAEGTLRESLRHTCRSSFPRAASTYRMSPEPHR